MSENNDKPKSHEAFAQILREYHAKLGTIINNLWKSKVDDDYEKSDDYQAALAYYRQFKQVEGVNYAAVLEYAKELHERHEKIDKSHDEKADSIIKYLGGGSALITFGALLSIKTDTRATCILGLVAILCLIPSLFAAVKAVSSAIKVRHPRAATSLPPITFAVDMAHFHQPQPEALAVNLWLILHPICEAAHFRNLQKAKLVSLAHSWYRLAMVLLFLPVAGITATLIAFLAK